MASYPYANSDSTSSAVFITPPSQRPQPSPTPTLRPVSPVTLDNISLGIAAAPGGHVTWSAANQQKRIPPQFNSHAAAVSETPPVDFPVAGDGCHEMRTADAVIDGKNEREHSSSFAPSPPATRQSTAPLLAESAALFSSRAATANAPDSEKAGEWVKCGCVAESDGIVEALAEDTLSRPGRKQLPPNPSGSRRYHSHHQNTREDYDHTSTDDFSPSTENEEGSGDSARPQHHLSNRDTDARTRTHGGNNGGEYRDDAISVDEAEHGSDEPLERKSFQPLRRWMKRMDPLFVSIFKWSLAGLLLCFLAFMVFGILYSGFAYHGDKLTSCGHKESESGDGTHSNGALGLGACDTPFGTLLGSHNGVIGFSNCNDEYVANDDNYFPVWTTVETPLTGAAGTKAEMKRENLKSGLQWQCVEYARRYWILRGKPEPAFFGDVEGANNIWDKSYVYTVHNQSRTLPLHRYPNGRSVVSGTTGPQVGDIIIYRRDPAKGFPFGHVAVIVAVESALVYVAEQNWASSLWPSPFMNYSRSISYVYDPKALTHTINDPSGDILGWMRYG